MILYHVTKSQTNFEAIMASKVLRPGRNVTDNSNKWVHLSVAPFYQGSWALDVIGADTNEAWILTLEVDDATALQPDPSGEGELYNGSWVVYPAALPVRIISVIYIKNVQQWESGDGTATHLTI